MMTQKMQLASMAEPYLGKYFSVYQVRHDLLGYTDGEIKEIDKQIAYERNVGIIPDPEAVMAQQNQLQQAGMEDAPTEGNMPEPDAEGDMDLSGDASQQLPDMPVDGGGTIPGQPGAGGPQTKPM
jgi:hypothetical protein